MKLYHFPLSPYSHKVELSFKVKGLEFESYPVNPISAEGQKLIRAEYPIGKLPLLKDGDKCIPESSIIVEYLDEISPAIPLIPANGADAREVRLRDRLADFYLSGNAITLFFSNLKPEDQRDQQSMQRAMDQISGCYEVIETMLEKNAAESPYFHGDQLTLADVSLVPALRISGKMATFDEYPKISTYYEHHSQTPSFKEIDAKATSALKEIMAAFKS